MQSSRFIVRDDCVDHFGRDADRQYDDLARYVFRMGLLEARFLGDKGDGDVCDEGGIVLLTRFHVQA